MKTSTDAKQAVEFLRWLFGKQPDGFIYVLRSRPSSDPVEARQDKFELNPITFSNPDKVDSQWWADQGHHWTMMFSTTTVSEKGAKNSGVNTVSLPALYCDIDGCKQTGVPGDEFFADIKTSEEASAWIRSSENGLQVYFKLDEPYEAKGDKEAFADNLSGLLCDIALYYGGDLKVVRLGGLMRLPGSLNIKQEYKGNYFMAKVVKQTDDTFSLKELRKRFKPDPDTVPKVVSYACIRALNEIWQEGERHEIMLRFAGSVRKHGINKEACKRLCKEVQVFFKDEDRTSDVDSTYETKFDDVMTLHSEYQSIAEGVERAIDFWLKLKVAYCKKRGFDFFPENIDPTRPAADDADFVERGLETWFHGPETDEIFANFVIRLKGRIVKADTGTSAWLAELHTAGEPPILLEISTEQHSQWHKFLSIPGVPVGISILDTRMWARYIAYLHRNCPNVVLKETTYYGWLDAAKHKPTLVMPGVEHEKYIWVGAEDTSARLGILTQEIDREAATAYLRQFIDYYCNYHEPQYIWPTLGWFSACSVKGLIESEIGGFPILVANGLTGTGKSYLIEEVMAVHYGSQDVMSFLGSTNFAFRTKLTSNNICPLVVGEFRTEARNKRDETKVNELLDLIRASFDRYSIGRGQSHGGLIKAVLQAPWCLVGEHQFEDSASVQRSIILTFDRKRVNDFANLPPEEQRSRLLEHGWLHDQKHKGWLGSILVDWEATHVEEVIQIANYAKELVNSTCPTAVDRKRTGCAAIVTGTMILARVCKAYGIKLPISVTNMLDYLYACDTSLRADQDHDTNTLRHLFEVTDGVIIEGHRSHLPHNGSMYVYDIDDDRYMYIDTTRWFRLIRPLISSSDSASLTDKNAFLTLIRNHSRLEDSPFVTFLNDHPVLGNCVKIDLERVACFGVSVAQWKGINEYEDL